ncbi:hypothetical protein ACFP81_00635 [Deinococcus lacus]|uniref:Uncharacterized protein n=1 Tax=Deinococcus lacus TaxID=392561 RepID=A0ABW1YCR4_9DEIO
MGAQLPSGDLGLQAMRPKSPQGDSQGGPGSSQRAGEVGGVFVHWPRESSAGLTQVTGPRCSTGSVEA